MSAFVIHIKSMLSVRKVKYYISRFVNSTHFKSKYVSVETSLYTVENTEIKLGDIQYIDLKNKFDLKSLYFIIIQNYFSLDRELKFNKIVFKYQELTKDNYSSHKII